MSATPENVDNPATPDVDVDDVAQQRPGGAGAAQYQEPEPEPQQQGSVTEDGEPVVEPQSIEQRANDGEVRIDVVPHSEQPDASHDDALVEQTDNSGEFDVEDAPQGADAVSDDELGDEDEGEDADAAPQS